MTKLDARTRDCIRGLCEAVNIIASSSIHLIGIRDASIAMSKAADLIDRMDELDAALPES